MKLGFNPKEVIASIVNVIAAYGVMSCGGNADMAEAAGSIAEGVVNSIEIAGASIIDKWKRLMYKAVEQALVPYELPQDCRNRLQEELFRDENFAAFIASYEPYEALCLMVSVI